MSEPCDDKVKSPLNHALSLPTEEITERSIRKQQSLRIKPVSKPMIEEQTSSSISSRSWSFGNVAKAVGCGVSAFGTGMVQGTKAVGSGVVQGTMVVGSGVVSVGSGVVQVGSSVGSGVVQGTKIAGKATVAAGKGVVSATEIVGSAAVNSVSAVGTATVSAGMAVGAASATAITDTTNWVIEKKDQILEEGAEEVTPMPGESLEEFCSARGIDPVQLIHANGLKSRKILSGRRLTLPKQEDSFDSHPMDHVKVVCINEESKPIVFATEYYKESQHDDIPLNSLAKVFVKEFSSEDTVPELLPAKSIKEPFEERMKDDQGQPERQKHKGEKSMGLVYEVDTQKYLRSLSSADSSTSGKIGPFRIIVTYRDDKVGEFLLTDEDTLNLVLFLQLWSPKILELAPYVDKLMESKKFDMDFGSIEEEFNFATPNLNTESSVLKEKLLMLLHRYLPPENQCESWNLEYSTEKDGFSLHNLYRRITNSREPILICIQDEHDVVLGAFLTCLPVMSESFIGNGNSWLYSTHGSDDLKVYPWSGSNEYFYRGATDHVVIGGGGGKFGLYLDSDLNKGRTDECLTFNNPPLTAHDFKINCLELWSFI